MIEEHRKTTYEALEWIKQGEKLCKEEIDEVSEAWEFLLEDESMEKIKEGTCQNDLKITTVKEDMKKLLIKEKIAKVAKLKQLQHPVKALCDQEKKINEEVMTQ